MATIALPPRPLHRGLRALLYLNSILVTLLGLPLFLFPASSPRFFPWPIDPPVTAAFLGANYLAAGVLEFAAARQRTWAAARVAVPGVLLFTTLTCILTFQSLGALDTRHPKVWSWLAVYAAVPPIMSWLWWRQVRLPGNDEPPVHLLSPWTRSLFAVLGAALWLVGLALLALPERAGGLWPWVLTPGDSSYLAAGGGRMEPYVGAWLIGLGTVAVQSAKENSAARIRPVILGGVALAALQGAVLLRFASTINWSRLQPYAFAAALVVLIVLSLAAGRTARPRPLTSLMHPSG